MNHTAQRGMESLHPWHDVQRFVLLNEAKSVESLNDFILVFYNKLTCNLNRLLKMHSIA